MIIGIDASRANRKLKTGTEWYSFALIQELKKIIGAQTGDRVLLYANEPLESGLENCTGGWEEQRLGWPFVKLWTQIRLSWEMLWRPPDVLFIPAHAIPLVHPKHTIVTIHDIGFERLPELYPWYDRLYHKFAVRFAVHRASHIIVPSEFTKRELIEVYGVRQEKITVVHHGYDIQFTQQATSPQPSPIRRGGSDYFLYIGRLEKKKNIVGLLGAFAEYRRRGGDRELILVGRRGYGYDKIRFRLHDSHFMKHVHEFGWIPQNEMPALLHGATALILPSLYEGFGLPVLEGFAAGVPVIASAIPALCEVGGDAAYYVPPYHPEMLSYAMAQIINDMNLRSSLITRGEERLQNFSWKKAAKATADVFAKCTSL